YAWRARDQSKRARENEKLLKIIREIHAGSRGTYGSPRVHAELTQVMQIRCSKRRVARLMREAGLRGVSRRKYHRPIRRRVGATVAPDLVNRRFEAERPNRLWVADIKQQSTREGWLYIA